MSKQTIWVDARMARRLKIIAARTGTTMLELANAALREYLKGVESRESGSLSPGRSSSSLADERM